ncbi:MAG: asparaginase, partial [Brachybacterium sp.]|nr:asparaginase [Brachybacterium sp.]
MTRAGAVESRHLGSMVLVGPDGDVRVSVGAPEKAVFPRSTLKPFQAVASLRAGAELEGEALALACASHVGSERHQDLAAAMLQAAGLGSDDLQCPAVYPQGQDDLVAHVLAGKARSTLAFNCSGKHAGFLAACRASGWEITNYLDPSHPIQRASLAVIEEYCGERAVAVGIDGCGAVAPAISLIGLARGTSRIARATPDSDADDHAIAVRTAMLEHPWAVHGEGRENTVVMEQLGLMAKSGAEGVLMIGAADGTAVAVKMLDGSPRGSTLAALHLLAAHGVIEQAQLDPVLEVIA